MTKMDEADFVGAVGSQVDQRVGRLLPERDKPRRLRCWYCQRRLTTKDPWHAVQCRQQYVAQHGMEKI